MSMNYDQLLSDHLGQFGLYQIFTFMIIGLAAIFVTFFTVGIIFLSASPEHWCHVSSIPKTLNLSAEVWKNLTIPLDGDKWSSCTRYNRDYTNWTYDEVQQDLTKSRENISVIKCDEGWEYSTEFYKRSIVTDWDLVCDDRWLQATAASVYMAASMVGVILSGSLSDAYGRKTVICVSVVALICTATIQIFSVNYTMFIVVRFFVGVGAVSLFTTAFVVCIEIVGPKWRAFIGIMIELFWVLGYALIPLFAYFIRDWQRLQLTFTVPCVILLAYFFLLEESPRWLYVKGENIRADKIVRKMARVNKVTVPEVLDIAIQKTASAYPWTLCSSPKLRIQTLNVVFIWCVNSLVYYGLSLNSADLSGNPYLNTFLSGIVECPAYFACVPALHYLGRRRSLATCMLFAGVSLLLTLAVPDRLQGSVSLTLVLIGKFGISASFAIVYVVTAEIFPTSTRNVAVSFGSFGARIGAVIAPFIGQLDDYGPAIPVIIFGVLSLIAGGMSLLLPETKGVTLPETLDVGEDFTTIVQKETDSNGVHNATFNVEEGEIEKSLPNETPLQDNSKTHQF